MLQRFLGHAPHRARLWCWGLFAISLLLAACQTAEPPSAHRDTTDIAGPAADIPPPMTRKRSETVTIDLVTKEVTAELAPGVTYEYWTYNGTVPGPFLRVREGDTVEIRLTHSAEGHDEEYSQIAVAYADEGGHAEDEEEEHEEDPHAAGESDAHAEAGHAKHSIDLHAVIGPGGGAPLMQTETGKTNIFRFKALRPGLYIYHCASSHIPTHIANGMYGLILVEPKEGLPPVDREFAVVQGEFYTKGPLGEEGHQSFSKEKLLREQPEYVVFNGRVAALTGEHALRAKTGEKIRLFFGVGSHIASNVHLIGGIFDRLYQEGAILSAPQRNVQTTIVPPGGAMMAEFTIDVPGTYLLVDHSLTRAIDRGAVAELVIEGESRPDLFSAVNPDPNHAHADLAVYIEGKRLNLSDPKYMSEPPADVLSQSFFTRTALAHGDEEDGHVVPGRESLHFHGGNGQVIHRHKPDLTLGDFFASIGFTMTRDCFTLDTGTSYCPTAEKKWRMFVNDGERPFDPGYVFADLDRILLTYGSTSEEILKQLASLTDDSCLYSRTCPERGEPPPENCIADPTVPCTAPL